MNTRRVDTGSATAGLVLAEPVLGPHGDVLLPAGVELSDRHLRALRAWGVTAVTVQGGADLGAAAAATEPDAGALAAARARIAPRFARSGTAHPLLALLAEEAARREAMTPSVVTPP